MAFIFNGTSGTLVTISGAVNTSIPTPSTSQEVKTAYATTINGSVTLLTASAGKTAYITDIVAKGKSTVSGTDAFHLNANGSQITDDMIIAAYSGYPQSLEMHLKTPIKVTTGNTLTATCNNNNVGVFVSYFEV